MIKTLLAATIAASFLALGPALADTTPAVETHKDAASPPAAHVHKAYHHHHHKHWHWHPVKHHHWHPWKPHHPKPHHPKPHKPAAKKA